MQYNEEDIKKLFGEGKIKDAMSEIHTDFKDMKNDPHVQAGEVHHTAQLDLYDYDFTNDDIRKIKEKVEGKYGDKYKIKFTSSGRGRYFVIRFKKK